ncbi:MAG: hypothetical protein WCY27_03855 [archaeon]|jgi:hypothetical protein|nr:hypothetical protein [archaeon]MDD2477949.1 hypothetical protein [Candidatus ainarchaeum sp.]MDD3084845.1 hypothetical protein [Candidatus ainarchaeum sp.]MDD4221253.1 hypothetical protein [Candidatus ainarchaeum sp.]MDD4662760.1 hypothetical protein [Candidatus ainarchaeum sp.]
MFKLRKIFSILLIISSLPLLSSFISSESSSSLSLSLKTTPDVYENNFYLSKNTSRQILFEVNSDYLPKDPLKTTKVTYNLKVFPENQSKDIDLSLSKKQDLFLSNISSVFSLNIRTKNFTENILKIKVEAILFDEYNNILSTDYRYLTLISNNSDYDFSLTPTRTEPIFRGYSFSKNILYLDNNLSTDSLVIKQHIDSNFAYALKCKSRNPNIITLTEYKGNLEFDLNVSIKEDSNLEKGDYLIDCFFYNENNRVEVKPIYVSFQNLNLSIDLNPDFQEEEQEDSNLSTQNNSQDNFLKNTFLKIKNYFKKP